MRTFIILLLCSFMFTACSSGPQVLETPSEEQKVETIRTSSIEKLRPVVTDEGIKVQDRVWVAYIKDVTDRLEIKRYDEKGDFVDMSFIAQKGHLLRSGDMLDSSVKSKAEVMFRDGTKLRVGPTTVLRIDSYNEGQDSSRIKINLLAGSVRLDVKGSKEKNKIEVHTPNAVVDVYRSDLTVKYDNDFKASHVACFSGEASVYSLTDGRVIKGYEKKMGSNDYMVIETTYEGPKEVYVARGPEKLDRGSKKEMLGSFYSDPEEIDPWEYTGISTNFLRFLTGFEYSSFTQLPDKYYSWALGYVPIIHLASVVYLEPYFELAFADPFSMTFFRTGARAEFQIYDGFYAGFGAGIFWVSDKIGKAGADIGFNAGYSFINKPFDFIDGLRFSYAISKTSDGYDQRSFLFSVLMSFSNGRDLF